MLNEELSFKEPISIYTLFVYMYKNGFLSKDKSIEFKVFYKKYLDIINLYGTNIFSGKGVCRHIGSMLTDILNESNVKILLHKDMYEDFYNENKAFYEDMSLRLTKHK